MSLAFEAVTCPPLETFSAAAPGAVTVGLVGENGSGAQALLRAAAGLERPASGQVRASGAARLFTAADPLEFAGAAVLLLDQPLALRDAVERAHAIAEIERLRRAGATILLFSHELDLIERFADEVWWLEAGRLTARGDPAEVIARYRHHIAGRLRTAAAGLAAPLAPTLRIGDGRARVLSVETLDCRGQPTLAWQSGEDAAIRVAVRFEQPLAEAVVGILIRNRMGADVYGTNTQLEGLKLGPHQAGETVSLVFRFRCALCPQEYTVTAASQDPDGLWHDWLDEAVAFSVLGSRYTAGVANLEARVAIEPAL
jgi:hypothetical protein